MIEVGFHSIERCRYGGSCLRAEPRSRGSSSGQKAIGESASCREEIVEQREDRVHVVPVGASTGLDGKDLGRSFGDRQGRSFGNLEGAYRWPWRGTGKVLGAFPILLSWGTASAVSEGDQGSR